MTENTQGTHKPQPAFKTLEIASFVEYMQFLNDECLSEDILFRGQREDWPLLPKIARLELKADPLATEREMLEQFKRESYPFIDKPRPSAWHYLIVAQHHGLATRLVDWTKNPLAALWFAVKEPAVESRPGIVWVYHCGEDRPLEKTHQDDPFAIDKTTLLRPWHIADRVKAQLGYFTVHCPKAGTREFVPFEEEPAFVSSLTKLVIPAESFCDMRYQLDRCGTNEATLFPDLDGLCRHIQWYHSLLKDEE